MAKKKQKIPDWLKLIKLALRTGVIPGKGRSRFFTDKKKKQNKKRCRGRFRYDD